MGDVGGTGHYNGTPPSNYCPSVARFRFISENYLCEKCDNRFENETEVEKSQTNATNVTWPKFQCPNFLGNSFCFKYRLVGCPERRSGMPGSFSTVLAHMEPPSSRKQAKRVRLGPKRTLLGALDVLGESRGGRSGPNYTRLARLGWIHGHHTLWPGIGPFPQPNFIGLHSVSTSANMYHLHTRAGELPRSASSHFHIISSFITKPNRLIVPLHLGWPPGSEVPALLASVSTLAWNYI